MRYEWPCSPRRKPAREAFDWGPGDSGLPRRRLDAEVDKVCTTLVNGPAAALRKTKEAINAATLTEFEGAFEREWSAIRR